MSSSLTAGRSPASATAAASSSAKLVIARSCYPWSAFLSLEHVPVRDPQLALARVLDRHGTPYHDVGPEEDVADHLEALALPQRRRPGWKTGLEVIQECVNRLVEIDGRRRGTPIRHEFGAAVVRQDVRVRTDGEQVVGGLHRREPPPRHAQCPRPREDLDRRTHRRLELDDFGRGAI